MMHGNDHTIIRFAKTDILSDECLFNALYGLVSDERRRRIDSLRFGKDKRLSLGAGILLQTALAEYGCDTGADTGFRRGEYGKPYLKGDENTYFNLSHSGEWVMCAVSDREVGCDIQQMGEAELKLAERYFLPSEYRIISAMKTEEESRDMFYRFWTLKESYMKTTGEGMKLPLDAFEIRIGERITVDRPGDTKEYYFSEYPVIDGYKAAVCIADSPVYAEPEIVGLKEVLS